jgi:VWFA-related protein
MLFISQRLSLVTAVLFLLAVCVAAQSGQIAAPKPTPTPDEDVVKISTSLIQLDVTVTDKNGKPVTDLKPDEVQVFENGQKQKVTAFNFVSNVRQTTTPESKPDKNSVPVPLPPRTIRSEQIHRTIGLVVDDLSLSFESAYQTRRALKKFVDEQMQDGDLVAIIRTGAGIGALQQFTSDKRVLYAAIDKVKWNPSGTGGVSAFEPINTQPKDPSTPPSPTDDAQSGEQSLDQFRASVFATGTLGALKYVVTGMRELPGRKSVILFSDGFKLFEKDDSGIETTGRVMDFLKVLIDAANRASVTVYTIDPRGLQYTGFTAADSVGDTSVEGMNKAMRDRSDQLQDTQDGLRYLAKETGGLAVVNTNDISGGVRKVLDDQSYYLVAYEPETDTFDAQRRRFNQISVKVTRPGVNVRYRSGFFNVAEDHRVAHSPDSRTPLQQLQDALVSPFGVRGIDLRMNALFGEDPKGGPFVRSLLHVDASNLTFTTENGLKKASIQVLAMAFGDNGQVVDQLAKGHTLTLSPQMYERIISKGFVYDFSFPVKKAGAYQYRVALRDATSGSVGSASQFVQVPDVKKGGLALSSLVINSLSSQDWENLSTGGGTTGTAADDTALRRMHSGGVLRYGFEIYDPKVDQTGQPHLVMRVRMFHDGKVFYEGKDAPVDIAGQTDLQHIRTGGALSIGPSMSAGDYVLQVVVTDTLAKQKHQIATQFVEFEIVP